MQIFKKISSLFYKIDHKLDLLKTVLYLFHEYLIDKLIFRALKK